MIDTHFHILPGIDDGPESLDDAVELGRAALAAGTRVIAATSHIDHGFAVEIAGLAAAREAVTSALAQADVGVEVVRGGEIALSRLVDLTDDELSELRLGAGRHLLVECPFTPAVGDMEPLVRGLRARGFETLLAHPERCPAFLREPARVGALVEAGALVQVTAGSLRGDFGSTVRRFAVAMLREGVAHCLASDAHDLRRRPPGLRSALDAAAGDVPGMESLAPWLVEAVPAAVLAGEPAPPRPVAPESPRRGLLARVLRRA